MDCPACHQTNIDGARFCAKCGALLPAQAAEDGDSLVGQIIGGRYRIIRILGEGGMGRVYLAEQQMGTNVRKVAVKTLQSQFAKDAQVLARFHRECGTVSQLEHPNTIQFFDFGQTPDGQLYIAMEFVQGQSLSDALQQGPMQPARVLKILAQVCGSLEEAHQHGIVHRDLKPDNVILSTRAGQSDFVKVLDFGIAKRSEAKDQAQEQKLTQQGMVLGTPPYMSPEQFTGRELDARSDIYSLGVMAYEMLTGRLPFDAETPWEWATQHMTAQPFPFEAFPIAASVPAPIRTGIMRALAKDPAQRPSSVRQFYEELAGAVPSAAPELPQVPTGGRSGTAIMPSGPHAEVVTPAGFGARAPALTPAGGQTFPTSPQPQFAAAPSPVVSQSNKGLIWGLAGLSGVLGIVALVILARQMRPKDDVPMVSASPPAAQAPATTTTSLPAIVPDPVPAPAAPRPEEPTKTAARPAERKPAPGAAASAAASATPTAAPAAPATPALTGDAACAEAKRLATNGDAGGAARVFAGCSGPGAAAAKSAIARSAPEAVRRRIFNGDCVGARAVLTSVTAIGATGGADQVLNDAAQCKGK